MIIVVKSDITFNFHYIFIYFFIYINLYIYKKVFFLNKHATRNKIINRKKMQYFVRSVIISSEYYKINIVIIYKKTITISRTCNTDHTYYK